MKSNSTKCLQLTLFYVKVELELFKYSWLVVLIYVKNVHISRNIKGNIKGRVKKLEGLLCYTCYSK